MPRYEFFCHNCKKLFSMVLSLVDYEEGDILCPTMAARTSTSAGPPAMPSRRRRAPDNRICGGCQFPPWFRREIG